MKLLTWNVRQFSQSKFENSVYYRQRNFSRSVRFDLTAGERLNYMRTVMKGAPHPHDLIAILEVMSSPYTGLGQPLSPEESEGLLSLLNFLKEWTNNDNWRLVPALKCNPDKESTEISVASETVGVFYNTDIYTFNGPDVYRNRLQNDEYPAPWNAPEISGRPGSSQIESNAAQLQFMSTDNTPLYFPSNYHRHPFMVDFIEKNFFGITRKVRCVFVHTSPHTIKSDEENYELRMQLNNGRTKVPTTQTLATREYAKIRELVDDKFNDNDLTIIAGDFNVNEYDAEVAKYSYAPLEEKGFQRIINKNVINSTLYQTVDDAWPQFRVGQNGYMREAFLDNCLIKLKSGKISPFTGGMPLDLVCPPFFYTGAMNSSLENVINCPTPKPTFREWNNFWHMNNTSDHLPLSINIE